MPDELQPEVPPSTSNQPTQPSRSVDGIARQPALVQPVSPTPAPSTPAISQPMADATPAADQAAQPASIVPPATSQPQPGRSSKKRLLMIGGGTLAALLLLAVSYVFAVYLPNTPAHVYSASLVNSGKAVDQLVAYSKQMRQANYQSESFSGTMHVKSSSGSYDVSLNGAADKHANANVQLSGDFLGEKVTANVRSVRANSATDPDVYFQIGGIKSLLDSVGANGLANYDGKWIVVDHTLIETLGSDLKSLEAASGTSAAQASDAPTYTEVQDAITKAQAVNEQYLFTTDSSKAVLANEEFLGRETIGGRTLDHYRVGYNKAHLEAYVGALGSALDSSKLNQWSKAANQGKSVSQALDLDKLRNTVRNAKAGYTFDLWADTKTKLVSQLEFADPSDKSTVFTLGQSYTGGTQYPFTVSVSGKDDSGKPQKVALNVTLDNATHKAALALSASDSSATIIGNFTLAPSKNLLKVSAPSGATSLTDILAQLGLGGLVSGSNSGCSNPSLLLACGQGSTVPLGEVNPGGPRIPVNTQ